MAGDRRLTTARLAVFGLADAMLLTCMVIWSVNVPLVRLALRTVPPLAFSGPRFFAAGLALLVPVLLRGELRLRRRHVPRLVMAALLGIAVNQLAFVYALSYTTASDVSLIFAATPLMVAVGNAYFAAEPLNRRNWVGIGVGLLGTAMIILAAPSDATAPNRYLGDIIALGGPLSWAGYLMLLRVLLRDYSPIALAAVALTVGSAPILILGAGQIAATPWASFSPGVIGIFVYSTLGAGVVVNVLYYSSVQRVGTTRAALYTYLQPFLGVLAASLILAERAAPLQVIGGAVVVAGVILGRAGRAQTEQVITGD
jgi:drug/metabolite transporter (DMT)-like permease